MLVTMLTDLTLATFAPGETARVRVGEDPVEVSAGPYGAVGIMEDTAHGDKGSVVFQSMRDRPGPTGLGRVSVVNPFKDSYRLVRSEALSRLAGTSCGERKPKAIRIRGKLKPALLYSNECILLGDGRAWAVSKSWVRRKKRRPNR